MTGRVAHQIAAAAIALALTVTVRTPVAATTPDPVLGAPWPMDAVLLYRWAAGAVPPSAMKGAVNAAAEDATGSRRSRAPSFAYSSGAPNGVSYGTGNPCGVNGLACFSRDPGAGYWHLWFRENGHRYDWGTLAWCEMTGSPYGCFNAETITLDEFGHVDGLDHHDNLADDSDYTDAVVQTVSRARAQAGWNASVFGRCDVATLQQVYDVAAWTTPYSTCLDVPTTLALTPGAAAVEEGTPVTFTATLRSDGAGRLEGNPMAGRTVVLQQRFGAGWADLVAMPAGAVAGTYVLAYAPKGSQDFRAVFRKPPSEGVRAATSAIVSIAVTCTSGPCALLAPAGVPQARWGAR